jgi:anti-sigma B factor antagonist
MSLEIESKIQDSIIEIKPIGEVDIYTSPELKNQIFALIEERNNDIIIDCESLDYIDSTGLGVLMSIYKKNAGKQFKSGNNQFKAEYL